MYVIYLQIIIIIEINTPKDLPHPTASMSKETKEYMNQTQLRLSQTK